MKVQMKARIIKRLQGLQDLNELTYRKVIQSQ